MTSLCTAYTVAYTLNSTIPTRSSSDLQCPPHTPRYSFPPAVDPIAGELTAGVPLASLLAIE